jgi:hypothetical protein
MVFHERPISTFGTPPVKATAHTDKDTDALLPQRILILSALSLGVWCTALLALSPRQRGIDELVPDGIGLPNLSHGGTGFFQRHALP